MSSRTSRNFLAADWNVLSPMLMKNKDNLNRFEQDVAEIDTLSAVGLLDSADKAGMEGKPARP